MRFLFSSCRTYMTRDKHDPRRAWLVYQFKTPRGVITLMQKLRVSYAIRKTVTYYHDKPER